MTKFSLLLSAALLTSCSHSYPEIPTERVKMTPFIARGNTPAWWLKLEERKVRFSANYGLVDIKAPVPIARHTNRGKMYQTPRLTVEITYTSCADRMSLDRYSEVVTIFADGQRYTGCGGMKLQRGSLNGTNWTVLSINDITILADADTHVGFDNGYASFRSKCGKVGGDFVQAENIVTFRRMQTLPSQICATYQTAHKEQLAAFLRGSFVISHSTNGDLNLVSQKNHKMILRRLL